MELLTAACMVTCRNIVTSDGKVAYWTTPLMEDPEYIRFSSYWDEIVATAVMPWSALVFFNWKIYAKIRASAGFEHRYVGKVTSIKEQK